MDNTQIAKRGSNGDALRALDAEWTRMNAALERLGEVEALQALQPVPHAARLVVALDLTASRGWSLKQARQATAAMFEAIASLGSVAVRLVYFRGRECKAGPWQDDPAAVSRSMLGLSCRLGHTKIARVLRLAADEPGPVSGIVYIGDHCEDDESVVLHLAATLGQRSIPLWVFHEIDDDERCLQARPLFQRMAELSGGVYTEFKSDSGAILRELLSSVAAFSTAGHAGLKQLGQPLTAEARQLQSRLLQLPAVTPGRIGLLPAPETKAVR